jgi:hypothetical protein
MQATSIKDPPAKNCLRTNPCVFSTDRGDALFEDDVAVFGEFTGHHADEGFLCTVIKSKAVNTFYGRCFRRGLTDRLNIRGFNLRVEFITLRRTRG